jgi:hypothetical protein
VFCSWKLGHAGWLLIYLKGGLDGTGGRYQVEPSGEDQFFPSPGE